jgi:hypothetical protein
MPTGCKHCVHTGRLEMDGTKDTGLPHGAYYLSLSLDLASIL